MESLGLFFEGLLTVLNVTSLAWCMLGVTLGTLIGALPGLGPSAGIAVLLPLTFGMDATNAVIMLAGIYYGAMFGGAITSILINTPGDSAAVMTTLDGYPLALKGRAGAAIGMATISSFVGGLIGVKVIILLIINLMLLLVGMFMDTLAAIIILTPILLPIVMPLGVNPIHFGVIMVVNLAIGFVTPPVGVNLFVASGIGKVKIEALSKTVMPLLLSMIFVLFLVTYIPALSLALPAMTK